MLKPSVLTSFHAPFKHFRHSKPLAYKFLRFYALNCFKAALGTSFKPIGDLTSMAFRSSGMDECWLVEHS